SPASAPGDHPTGGIAAERSKEQTLMQTTTPFNTIPFGFNNFWNNSFQPGFCQPFTNTYSSTPWGSNFQPWQIPFNQFGNQFGAPIFGQKFGTPYNTPFNFGGFSTPFNYGFNTPFNYGYTTPFSGMNTPWFQNSFTTPWSSFGYNQFNTPFNGYSNWTTPFNYGGINSPFSYGFNTPYSINTPWTTPFGFNSTPWTTPYSFGGFQNFNTPYQFGFNTPSFPTNWQGFSPIQTPSFNWGVPFGGFNTQQGNVPHPQNGDIKGQQSVNGVIAGIYPGFINPATFNGYMNQAQPVQCEAA
ncbi:MAG: hypothetical protein VYC34_06125, partial [Planctomycetota bacterium]|nr:hypothetical protein [Planctomycetota bacterium]